MESACMIGWNRKNSNGKVILRMAALIYGRQPS
jgi:hypothetical protein